jgi:SAM-dependent methyltransferase
MPSSTIDARKLVEAEFHDRLRDPELGQDPELFARLTSNRKWYSVNRASRLFTEGYLQQHSRDGARALDYACGDGYYSLLMAEAGAKVTGIDISPTSVANAKREAHARGFRAQFEVMDCEQLSFSNAHFDLINVNGVLHHLDLAKAYPELARVLKPSGSIICVEALAHNLVFHAYRRLTPHLRTEFETEHILRRRDVMKAKEHFRRVEWRFFHLASLAAVPFRKSRLFEPLLSALDMVDGCLLRIPGFRWWAWQIAFVLSEPRR